MKRPVSMIATAAALTMMLPVAVAAGPARAQSAPDPGHARPPASTVITIGGTPIAREVPREIVGANHRWPKSGLGMWDAAKDQPVPRIVELSRRAGVGVVRYPGGTVANLFAWKKAVGPQGERGCQVGGGFVGAAEPMDSVYGPDEQQQFVDTIDAETTIMTNGSGQPAEDAADFVEYMNARVGTNPNGGTAWAQVRADNGHPQPYAIRVWEVGNEVYLGNQHYWRSADLDIGLRQYVFGGTQRQLDQPVGARCDHRPEASRSDGSPGQEFVVWYPPVVPDSQVVRVDGEVWRPVADLDGSGPDAAVYTVDPKTGELSFGNGVHGRIPPAGQEIHADYDSGPHPGFVDYYRAMKAVDRSISVCSAWEKPEFVELMGSEHPYNCVGPHLYANPDVRGTPAEIHDRSIPLTEGVVDELTRLEQAMAAHGPRGRQPFLEVSEYGSISLPATRPAPEGWAGSVSTMLLFANIVAGMVEHDVVLAASSNLNADVPTAGELFGGAPTFVETARARMLGLVSHLVGTRPVSSRIAGNPVATGAGDYPALRVLATRAKDGGLRLLVLNRDRERDVTARLDLPGGREPMDIRVSTLNGADIASYNTAANPDAVRVTTATTTTEKRSPFAYPSHEFPAHSVTLVEIPGPGEGDQG